MSVEILLSLESLATRPTRDVLLVPVKPLLMSQQHCVVGELVAAVAAGEASVPCVAPHM